MVAKSPRSPDSPTYRRLKRMHKMLADAGELVDQTIAKTLDLHRTLQSVQHSPIIAKRQGGNSSFSMSCPTGVHGGGNNKIEARKMYRTLNQTQNTYSSDQWKKWCSSAAGIQRVLGDILEARSELVKLNDLRTPERTKIPFNASDTETEESNSKDRSGLRKENGSNKRGSTESKKLRNIKGKKLVVLESPPKRRLSLLGHLKEEGSNYFNNLDKEWENLIENRSQKHVHKFKLVTPENKVKELCQEKAASSLELHRKVEKQKRLARRRTELSQKSPKARHQMTFHADPHRNRNARELTSAVMACSLSPAKTPKQVMKAEEIAPSQKLWNSHRKPAKAIMFPNPTFVSSPSDTIKNRRKTKGLLVTASSMSSRKKSPPSKALHEKRRDFILSMDKENQHISVKSNSVKPISKPIATKASKCSPSRIPLKTAVRTPLRALKRCASFKADVSSSLNRNMVSGSLAEPVNVRSSLLKPNSAPTTPKASKHSPPPKISLKTTARTPLKALKQSTSFKVETNSSFSKVPLLSSPTNKSVRNIQHKQLDSYKSKPLINETPSLVKISSTAFNSCFGPGQNATASETSAGPSPIKSLPALISKLPARKNGMPRTIPNGHFDGQIVSDNVHNEKGSASISTKVLPLPPGRTNAVASISKLPDETCPHLRGRSVSCPRQRPLEAVCNKLLGSPKLSLAKHKDQNVQGKENRYDNLVTLKSTGHSSVIQSQHESGDSKGQPIEERVNPCGTEGYKPMTILKRSLSIGAESATFLTNESRNSTGMGTSALLKYMKGFMKTQKQ